MSQLISSCCCRELNQRVEEEKFDRGLLCKNAPPSKDLGLSELLATKLAIDALKDYKPESIPFLPCRQHRDSMRAWPFLVFDALDAGLFRGVLKGEVYMTWAAELPDDVHGITCKPGVRDMRVTIELNPRLKATYPYIRLTAMIHHMAHAYFLLCCGVRNHPPKENNLGHGLSFSSLMCKIMEIEGPTMMDLSQLSPSGGSPPSNQVAVVPRGRRGPTMPEMKRCSVRDGEQLPKDTCRDHLVTLNKMKVSELMGNKKFNPYPKSRFLHTVDNKKSILVPVARAHYRFNPKEEIEMKYSSYVIPFPRKKLKGFSSLSIRDSTLEVPAQHDSIFIAFHAYLLKGDYPPELTPSPYQNGGKTTGPPIIKHFHSEFPAHLWKDVQVFILASRMSFMELKRRSLQRMYAMCVIQEDPMAVLEEIYKDNGVNGEDRYLLREWCRDFLRRMNPEIGINITVIEHSGQCRDRFQILARKSDAFREDCRRAKNCYVIEKAIRFVELAASSDKRGKVYEHITEMTNKLRAELLDARRLHALEEPTYSQDSETWAYLPGPSIESLPLAAAGEYTLSRADLQHLQERIPSVAMCYENVLDEQKEAESKAKEKSKDKEKQGKDKGKDKDKDKGKDKDKDKGKNKDKGKDKGKGKGKDKDSDDDSSTDSGEKPNQCAHRCALCRPGDRTCTHPEETCLYCGASRFSRRLRGILHPSGPSFPHQSVYEPHYQFPYAPL